MKSRHRKLWAGAAAAYLALLVSGATHFAFPHDRWYDRAYEIVGTLAGTLGGFAFFAPSIGSEIRARFEIIDEQGHLMPDELQPGANRETELRVKSLVSTSLANAQEHDEIRRMIVASFAGKMFARHPEARKVTVILEVYELPSLNEYRYNPRTGWMPIYEAVFTRRATAVNERWRS